MRQDLRTLRRKLAGMPKIVTDVRREVAILVRERDAQRAALQPDSEAARGARFSGGLIQKLRRRLKLTQGQLALLTGVSVTAVRAWEANRSRPQGARRAALVALRKLGRRERRSRRRSRPARQGRRKKK
jgi:DNA-binding transcriptional regulator YiaG